MGAIRSSGSTSQGRYTPVVYLVVALVAGALLLPTALRPPIDQQSSSAAFSPDAPPDDTPPEALLQAIRQASSSTAGGTINETAAAPEVVTTPTPPPPPVRRPVRNRCFGDPPRQTESLYSALCVPAWTGSDNGGETSFGVTGEEIRIGIGVGESSTVPEGPLAYGFSGDDSDETHDLKVWQTYFNDRFEFYGRKLHFVVAQQSITDEDQQRQSVEELAAQKVFAITAGAYGQPSAAQAEAARRKIVDVGAIGNACSYFQKAHPYAYSFIIDGCQARKMHTELACKQLAGKPPGSINKKRDTLMNYSEPRKWGLILYQDEVHFGGVEAYKDDMAKCGVTFEATQQYNLTSSQQDIAGTMAKMKQAGVTTVMISTEVFSPIALTYEAARLAYYPEWVHIGLEIAATARLYDVEEVGNMVGLGVLEIPRSNPDTDWFRAYKEIDPDGEPAEGPFRSLQQIAGGIQGAGPHLTPETFWEGLQKLPHRVPDPIWSVGGGYGPNDYTYMDYGSLIWWDWNGKDPNSTSNGSWQFVNMGKRYRVGELPTEPVAWWDTSSSMTSPPKGTQG